MALADHSFSVIVPVYRSASTLATLTSRITAVMDALGGPWECIFVEDGGRDESWSALACLVEQHPTHLRAVRMSRNYGQHNAILCGIRMARGAVIVTLDDDLQNPPEEIPVLLAALLDDVDVVYGYPRDGLRHGLLRNLASRLTKWVLQSAIGADTARHASSFRVFRTRLREAFAGYHGPQVMLDVMLTWGTTRFAAVPVRHEPRLVGESGYTLRKLIVHGVNMVTGFAVLPLQIASLVGFFFSVAGFILLLSVFVTYLVAGRSVPGFAFLASAVTLFAGVQLFALGVIGEYVARIHFRSMGKPTYAIGEVAPASNSHAGRIDGPSFAER